MIAAIRLGLRLAGLGAVKGQGRAGGVRSLMVAMATLVGTLLVLGVAAVTRSEQAAPDHGLVSDRGLPVLLATVFIVAALPVVVLAATVARLAAAMRDRRLANLRLLGLPAGLTRLVAVVETGVSAVAGALAGWVGFVLLRPILARWHPAGQNWTTDSLRPSPRDYLLIVVVVPLVVVLVSAIPQRTRSIDALALARRSTGFRPAWWRVFPLLAGSLLAGYVLIGSDPTADNAQFTPYLLTGIVLIGVGVILSVPIFVRLVADVLVRRSDHVSLVIAGRRLQMQPAAMTRVVAGLLIGLFLVTGARAVVVAFEQTPKYQSAARMKATGVVAALVTSAQRAPAVRARLNDVDQIQSTIVLPTLVVGCRGGGWCVSAVVGTCAELRAIYGTLLGCRDDQPMWLHSEVPVLPATAAARQSLDWQSESAHFSPTGPRLSLPTPQMLIANDEGRGSGLDADVYIPRTTPGIAPLLAQTRVTVFAIAKPGVDLAKSNHLHTGALAGFSVPDWSYYNFVAGLRAVVWAIGAIVLSIGLLAYAIAATDRAISRRREIVALQLVGVSGRVLRRVQLIEAALPLVVGIVLAVGLGALAGAAYLAFGSRANAVPWHQTLTIAGISLLAAAAVAGLTVIAANPSIQPDLIRSE